MLHTALNECFHFTVLHVKYMLYRAINDWYDFAVLHVAVFMMLLLCSGNIGKFKCFIGCEYTNNAFDKGVLYNQWFDFTVLHVKGMIHRSLNDWSDFAVLHVAVFIIYVVTMLLLCSGDIELNPGPGCYVVCPSCNIRVHIRKKTCECGYRLFRKCGRLAGTDSGHPMGTTRDAGFTASTGHPTSDIDIDMNVPTGRPVGTTRDAEFSASTGHPTHDVNIEINVPTGRPVGTTQDAGFNASTGRPTSDIDIEMNVPSGRPVGTTQDAGFNASTGHPTSDIDIKMNVPTGRPVGTTRDAGFSGSTGHPTHDVNIEMNVPTGRPVGTTQDAGFNALTGHPTSDIDIEMNVPTGRPVGTTQDAGFSASTGCPDSSDNSNSYLVKTNYNMSTEQDDIFIEDNLSLLFQYMKQYDLPTSWNTDSLSLNDDLLVRAKKRIGQQVRFDAKPLGIGMCYCCGSILWSRVDNSHTRLVSLDVEDNNIPAVSYQCAMVISSRGCLDYRHKSGKLYVCSVCSSYKNPTEYSLTFHVGKTPGLTVTEWDMVYPPEVTSLKSEAEKCQVALCGIFSTTIKDAKKHQWRHIQGEVNALHKLDRHYYGMFGFLMIKETITEKLTKYSGACERIRIALNWFKKKNNLYKQFLARFETMYRYLRHDVVNPDILKGSQDKILESEAIGMAFPVDSEYFDQYSPLHGNMDIAGIQNPQPHMIDKVQDSVKWLRECTSVQYGQEYLLEKTFPHLFPYGEGGWQYKCSLGFSQFTKIRLLDPRGHFANDVNFPFFMFDYMTKIRLRSYNARKVVTSGKLEEKLTAGKVMAADRHTSDPYDSYGTEVPRVIPGSKQYWKSFGYDLVAMTEQLGIPDFFLTLSPNDNWPHIQSTIRKGWGASADPSEFQDLSCKPDNEQAVGPNPLESVLGAEKCFSAMMDILLDKKSGPLGIVVDFAVKKEYQKQGGLHWHILFWVQPGSTPDNVVLAEMPRSSDTQNVQAQYARKMV